MVELESFGKFVELARNDPCTTHMPTQMFVSVICRCSQITPSIGIGTRYRYGSRPKVSVSEVSVNCGIGLTLVVTDVVLFSIVAFKTIDISQGSNSVCFTKKDNRHIKEAVFLHITNNFTAINQNS